MRDIMLDLECLDSRDTATIVSIGAVFFDIQKKQLGEVFYVEIDKRGIQEQLDRGLTWSIDTFIWWMSQTDEARKVFIKNSIPKSGIQNALHLFSKFCEKSTAKPRVWGNGVDYDNTVLRNCYNTFNIECPFHHRYNRCYRTTKALFNRSGKGLVRHGTHHNGLDDAISQAYHLMKMFDKVGVNS
jgi:inhibitor of KinA sporulation pathway (predicted exonuclease)